MKIRLSTKLILSVVAVEAAMLSLLVWNSVRIINTSYTEYIQRSIEQETELIANALSPGLAAHDRALLTDTLSLLNKNKSYVYAKVYDYSGELLAENRLKPHFQEEKPGPVNPLVNPIAKSNDVIDTHKDIYLAGQLLGSLSAGYSLEMVQRLTEKARYQNTTIAVFTLILSVLATIGVAYYLIRRLGKLEEGARALAEGNLSYRIDVKGSDEITDLAGSFNHMALTLSSAREELEKEHIALERETTHLQTLMNGLDAVVLEANPAADYRFIYVSGEATDHFGYEPEEWLTEKFWFNHVHPEDLENFSRTVTDTKRDKNQSYSIDYRMRHKNGRYIWVRSINSVVPDDKGNILIQGLMLDITEEKKAEERIIYLAEHDALTGLYNRRRFQDELEHHIALAKRYRYQGAVLFIDLDQFKYINDSIGHQGGDEFLIKVSNCLTTVLRETDVLGRIGGDEFGIIMARAEKDEIEEVANKILNALREQIHVANNLRVQTSASIGVSVFPEHGTSTGELLAKADAAMYGVKASGRNGYSIYDVSDQRLSHMRDKIHWEDRIRRALAEDDFILHFQPIVNLENGETTHHEVLLRMYDRDADRLIMPNSFLDTAERFGLIKEIDMWVIENAIRIAGESSGAMNNLGLGINLSGRNLGDAELLHNIESWINKYHAEPGNLIIEVTETAAVDNLFQARKFIEALRSLGCRFALDDFGMGFSSLHYLRNLTVDFIKIDGSFITKLESEEADRIMVKAIANIAKGLGIQTIAECVESESTLNVLKSLNVDMAQGYLLGVPQEKRMMSREKAVQKQPGVYQFPGKK